MDEPSPLLMISVRTPILWDRLMIELRFPPSDRPTTQIHMARPPSALWAALAELVPGAGEAAGVVPAPVVVVVVLTGVVDGVVTVTLGDVPVPVPAPAPPLDDDVPAASAVRG